MRKNLTKAMIEHIKWAIGPMDDHWCTEDGAHGRDGPMYPESDLPRIQHGDLFLSNVGEINADLLYRLEEQLPDMCRQGDAPRNGATAALRAAEIIRKFAADQNIPIE